MDDETVALAISYADIEAAAARIEGVAVRTPLMTSPILDDLTGARVFIKPECLQRTGSFKFRGAYNRLAAMSPEERARGIVAASSGNHAQGAAEAARLFGAPATIVMPSDAPSIKRDRTRRSGAEVVGYERGREDRVAIATRLTAAANAKFVPPYDDPFVMAGQGTAGLEAIEDLEAAGVVADAVLVPAGGGGLMAGISVAFCKRMPDAACYTVEPEGFDDTSRSLLAGERVANPKETGSIADALMAQKPGELTFPVNRQKVRGGLVASETAMLKAMAFAARELKLVVEPGGAVALAALMAEPRRFTGKVVVCVLSGGNVDDEMLKRALDTA
ncbi:MAG: threonine/serine dehydratase [Pseudomonadota bacterium]